MQAPISASYPIRVEELVRLMKKHGLSQEALATKAVASVRTVKRLLQGGRAQIHTVKKIAAALDVSCDALLPVDGPPEVAPAPQPTNRMVGFKVTISLDLPFDLFDETTTLPAWLEKLSQQIGQVGQIVVETVKPGTVTIECHFTDVADVRSLVRAFAKGELFPLAIIRITPDPSTPDMTAEIARSLSETLPAGSGNNPREVEQRIRTIPGPSWRDYLRGFFMLAVGPTPMRGVPWFQFHSVPFQRAAGGTLKVDYNSRQERVTSLSAEIPSPQLREAQQSWTKLGDQD